MRIYTKGGDRGTTGIFGGTRVDKDDIRIEANGTLDELNASLGVIRALLNEQDERQEILAYLQRSLMIVMSQVSHSIRHPGRESKHDPGGFGHILRATNRSHE